MWTRRQPDIRPVFSNHFARYFVIHLCWYCALLTCVPAAFNIKLAIQVYYTQYVLNDINLLSWMGFFSMGCILVGVLLVPLTVKCFGKKQVYLAGMVLWAVGIS